MKSFVPEYICIDEASLNDEITKNVLNRFPDVRYEVINPEISGGKSEKPDMDNVTKGKRTLFLQRNRGPFIERCPGTKDACCCNYYVANLAINCHFDCTYCYLQGYLNSRNITVNTNIEDFFREVEELYKDLGDSNIRIGTGELADSLAMDEITDFSLNLVPFFTKFDNFLLELKTKGNYTENLLKVDPQGKTVISWSLNPQKIIDTEEYKTSSLIERLDAAKKCNNAGYKIAFHFDPIIRYEGWENDYKEVTEKMFDYVNPDDVLWISLGVLRYTPAGKTVIQERFPKTDIIYDEMVQCRDGKLRYIQPVRSEIFRKMRSWLASKAPNAFIYLCMENTAVWDKVYGEDNTEKDTVLKF
ncbi:radical SAM protein [candidate division KSB1 bacterium]